MSVNMLFMDIGFNSLGLPENVLAIQVSISLYFDIILSVNVI